MTELAAETTASASQVLGGEAPQETQTAAPEVQPTETSWYGEIESPDLSDWAKNKGFKTPADALSSYHKLEKFMGADKAGRGVVIPKEGASDEEINAFYDKIGRPESPEGYELPIPEGNDPEFANNMAQLMHESGVPKSAAQKLAEGWNEHVQNMEVKHQEEMQNQFTQQEQSLRSEWGAAYDKNVHIAQAASRELGLDGDKIEALQSALGFDGVMKMFVDLGSKISEDTYVSGESGMVNGVGRMTPQEAARAMDAFNRDPENMRKISNGDAATIAKRREILKQT